MRGHHKTNASNHPGLALPKGEPRTRTKSRKDRAEAVAKRKTREIVAVRDGHCRLNRPYLRGVFGACTPVSEWAHFGTHRRALTRGQAPEARHTTAGSLMLCGGSQGGHHFAYDKGTGARRLMIEATTDRGADGPLRFTFGAATYLEPDLT